MSALGLFQGVVSVIFQQAMLRILRLAAPKSLKNVRSGIGEEIILKRLLEKY